MVSKVCSTGSNGSVNWPWSVRSVTRAKMVNTTILQMTFRPQMKAGVGRCGVQGIQEENSEGYES